MYMETQCSVVWVYFCRSAGQQAFEQSGVVSVQMIGYNMDNGATCFFESPDAVGDMTQSEYLEFDEDGLLDGEFPYMEHLNLIKCFTLLAISGANCVLPY